MKGPRDQVGEELLAEQARLLAAGSAWTTGGGKQRCQRIVAENAANSAAVGGKCATLPATATGRPACVSPLCSAVANPEARPAVTMLKKTPMLRRDAAFWNVERMPEATPRDSAGTLFMMATVFGAANMPWPMPSSTSTQEGGVRKVGRQQRQPEKADHHQRHAERREEARAEPVREPAAERAHQR